MPSSDYHGASTRLREPTRPSADTTPAHAWQAPAPCEIALADPDGGSLQMAGVRRALEVFGFTFENSPLAAGSPRTLGKKSTTVVELFGTKYIAEMSVAG